MKLPRLYCFKLVHVMVSTLAGNRNRDDSFAIACTAISNCGNYPYASEVIEMYTACPEGKIRFSFTMDTSTIEKRFLRINKQLGLLIGVWPYQKDTSKRFARMLVLCLLTSCYITQYSRLVLYCSVDVILKDYPYILASFGIILKLGNYFINETKLKSLLGGIYEDWKAITSKDECAIMTKYAERGVYVVILYVLHMTACSLLFICLPIVPPILNIIKPLNESRARLFIYPAYYFVDDGSYYYLIILHMASILALLCLVFCACDANYIYAVQHACGLLAISGYRFKYACQNPDVPDERNVMNLMNAMYKNVSHSIRGHRRALQYIKEIENTHDTYLFVSVGLLTLSLSVSLLEVAEGEHEAEWLTSCAFFLGQLFHMFVLTVQGQFVMNSYDRLYDNISEAMWYNSRRETQGLYVLALRRSLDPPLLTAGGFVRLNLRTFAEIVKASLSYYTMMQSK